MSPEQREAEQEEGSEGREEGQDSPIACGDDIHLYDNQISPGPGQYTERWSKGRGRGGGYGKRRREKKSWIQRLRMKVFEREGEKEIERGDC